jgi:hypothetical protein
MSHPGQDHYLGEELAIPYLQLRLGVFDDVDVEAFGTFNPQSNYGFFGVASKITIVPQTDTMPVSIALRPSLGTLAGPSEVQLWNFATDLSASRRFYGFAPFAGVTFSSTLAVDDSDDTNVGNQLTARPIVFGGLDYHYEFISVGAQAEISALPSIAARVGGRF